MRLALFGRSRREALTVRAALSTIFATHNETGNIWTHLLGGLMFAAMAVAFAFQPDPHPPASATHGVQVLPSVYPSCSVRPYAAPPSTPAPKWPQLLLLIAFSQVLLVSATCHTLCCISRKVYATIWRLDYAAISLAITATFVPFVWYAFDCAAPGIRTGYLAVACALGAVNFAVNMAPMFQHYRFRVMRLLLFIAQATWGLVPIIHATALYWGSECGVKAAITLTWAQISLNIMGAVVFATHWPERWFPGRFDTWASSHQIFHVFIVAVFLTYSQAGRVLWAWRSAKGECPVVM